MREKLGWPELNEKVRSGIAHIQSSTCEDGASYGTGFLIDEDLIVTAAHVVRDAAAVDLRLGGQLVGAEILGMDENNDTALLRTQRPVLGHHFEILEEEASIGTSVAALGFPLATEVLDNAASNDSYALNPGIINARNQTANYQRIGVVVENLLQTNADINPGNSGGPVIDETGQVVGLVSGGLDLTRDEEGEVASIVHGKQYAVSSLTIASDIYPWRQLGQALPFQPCETEQPPTENELQLLIESDHEYAPAIAESIWMHADAINRQDYATAFELFTAHRQEEAISAENWSEDLGTSSWMLIDLYDVVGNGREATASVVLLTHQDPAHSPAGTTDQSCSWWSMEYSMLWEQDQWLIDRARSLQTPTDCEETG